MDSQSTYRRFDDEDTIYEREGILVDKEAFLHSGTEDKATLNGRKQEKPWCRNLCDNLWLVPVVCSHFWMSALCVLMTPFFPPLASSRGLDPWKFGFVFSSIKMGTLVGSVMSSYVSSPRRGYLTGQIGAIVTGLLLAALYWVRDANTLLGCSIFFALFFSAMVTMYFSSLYAVLTSIFDDRAGILIATMEFLFGLGAMTGFWFGGFLVDMWAFPLAFFVMSGFIAVACPFMACVRPRWKQQCMLEEEGVEETPTVLKYKKLFLNPAFIIDMITGSLPLAMIAFNEDTLEPYLRQFHLSSTKVGSVFTIQSLGYCAGAIISGIFSLYRLDSCIMLLGTALCCISYLIIGPAPFIETGPNLNLVYLSMILSGFGSGPLFICGYNHGQRTAIRIGYPDDIKTTTVVSSTFFATLCLGSVGTAPFAGYLVSVCGYRTASVAVSGFLLFWVVVLCLLCASDVREGRRTEAGNEYQKIGWKTTRQYNATLTPN